MKHAINLTKKANEIRRDVIEISYRAGVGHIAPALSIIDILTVLYFSILRINPKNPTKKTRDRFILSKGHAAAALYATLRHRGFFTKKKLRTYCQDNGAFGVHPDYNIRFGVELTTGSLGHGLAVGAGMAISLKDTYPRNSPHVFVLVSDAELNEGSVWETIMFASHQKLDNLTLIIDDNGLQAFGRTKDVLNIQPIEDKLNVFGWQTMCVNGHDMTALEKILTNIPFQNGKPNAVVAKTIGGKGISFMEDTIEWHYLSLSKEQYKKALKELL